MSPIFMGRIRFLHNKGCYQVENTQLHNSKGITKIFGYVWIERGFVLFLFFLHFVQIRFSSLSNVFLVSEQLSIVTIYIAPFFLVSAAYDPLGQQNAQQFFTLPSLKIGTTALLPCCYHSFFFCEDLLVYNVILLGHPAVNIP